MQAYDQNVKDYMPVSPGIGMHVEVRDPNDKIVLSRVSLSFSIIHKFSHSVSVTDLSCKCTRGLTMIT